MSRRSGTLLRSIVAATVLTAQTVPAQVVIPPGFNRPGPPVQSEEAPPPKPEPAKPDPSPAEAKPAKPAAGQTSGGLNLQNASLTEVIKLLAQALKINYILDPRVKGSVTINTYGETKAIDNRALLDTILNINGAAMVQSGDIYRIVPLTDVQRLPGLEPHVNGSPIPDDDSIMLNLIFLKYATVDELAKLIDQFRGEHAKMWSYPPANLLLIQDTRRNMRRLMQLVSLFDSEVLANQRVKLFDIRNSRPSDLAKELEGILKGISLNEQTSPIKLLPVDRINTLIAVAPNPGVFGDVEEWIRKLDVAVTSSAGAVENFVYRVKYGYAPTLAMAIMGLYSDDPMFAMGLMMAYGGAYGGMGGGGMFGGAYGAYGVQPGVMGMGGMPGMMGGMYGGGMYGGGMYGGGMYGGGMGYPGGMYGGGMYGGGMYGGVGSRPAMASPAGTTGTSGTQGQKTDQTGTYLSATTADAGVQLERIPRIVPNPFDNTLLIQATRQEYEGIQRILRDIDVPPRQVLIEAKIYEVTLTGALTSGVSAYLQTLTGGGAGTDEGAGSLTQSLTGALVSGNMVLSAGTLVGQSRRLLAAFSTKEIASRSRLISAPTLVATDSVPASINVGTQVPTLSAQAVTGAQQGGTSLFANSIQNRDSGVTLNVMARVNPSGIVTLTINQEVSAPQAPDPDAAIQSPSFSKRTVQTQVTLQDADTIAIGGIINESKTNSSSGIPVLSRLPVVGMAFGSRASSNERTELVIFMTPRVIYDMNDMNEATEELKNRLKKVTRYINE